MENKYGNRSGQGAGFHQNIKLASAPMVPTPYVCQKEETSTNQDWEHEDQTDSGEHIQRVKMLPSVGGQQRPHCVEYHNDPSGVTEPPCIGSMKALPGVGGPDVIINQGLDLNKGWMMYDSNARIPTPPTVQSANQYRMLPPPMSTPHEFQPNRNKDQLNVELNTAGDTSLQNDRGGGGHTSPRGLTYLGAKPKTKVYNDYPGYNEPHHSPFEEQQRIWSECVNNKTVEEVINTRSGDPRMDGIQGPVYNGPTHTPPRDVGQYRGWRDDMPLDDTPRRHYAPGHYAPRHYAPVDNMPRVTVCPGTLCPGDNMPRWTTCPGGRHAPVDNTPRWTECPGGHFAPVKTCPG